MLWMAFTSTVVKRHEFPGILEYECRLRNRDVSRPILHETRRKATNVAIKATTMRYITYLRCNVYWLELAGLHYPTGITGDHSNRRKPIRLYTQ